MSNGSRELDDSAKLATKWETQEQLTKLREITLGLEQENLALREEIQRLREEEKPQATESNLEFAENVYWLLQDNQRVGPFCPHCYSERHRLATLLNGARFVAKTRWICPDCNRVFDSET